MEKGARVKTVAIIGGGAAGLAAAVAAGEALRKLARTEGDASGSQGAHAAREAHEAPGGREVREAHGAPGGREAQGVPSERETYQVVVFEADERVGRSVLATGNGRCNFSNASVSAADYRNGDFVGMALMALSSRYADHRGKRTVRVLEQDPVCEFFGEHGLMWREEEDGRRYPVTNKASTVLDVLRAAAKAAGVREECGRGVEVVEAPRAAGGQFTLRMADGALERADAVVLACGGRAGLGVAAGGHAAVELAPSGFGFASAPTSAVLGPLKTDTRAIKGLDGVRVRCAATLDRGGKQVAREQGEVLFRTYGLSGIAVFDLSRFARAGDVVAIDFLPYLRSCDEDSFVGRRRKQLASHGMAGTCDDFLRGLLLPAVARAVLAQAGVEPGAPCGKETLAAVMGALKHFMVEVEGTGDARQCQVARGGLCVDAFDPSTMESRACSGFFVAGEAMDVDAPCGGYNLHWAWTSGILAGIAAAEHVVGE